ncbi:MAG: exodeoxyribonuclease III [Paracoccus sp. (in: a-proteobacteria)]|uniref:exodeoxyribonuclease III n=2 Tax=Paracoccus TaxID=265 RepID=UPI000C384448|nr:MULTISPECIES: exodeoxyribonuclease III [unclassified Paracoccus (in: a-proteobacteria)]MBA48994.1 exodeoxyribonuclease III [Paracoccus sp. (in: a-proteobacteria)]HIC67442.1 exodeoxyribonuclease III [Paracoccus sp. (in: a-proteobacteria)]|tara:strand:+ start:386 stop:1171 length:786 start_codon:yes stop_codon:yes gene_type:complete
MKIASFNINGVKARIGALTGWLAGADADVVVLQEIKSVDEGFPRDHFEDLGWNVETHGQKGFNGVAILSKLPLEDVRRGLPGGEGDEQARYIEATVTGSEAVRIAGLYLPNGNPAPGPKYDYKLAWMERLRLRAARFLAEEMPVVMLGDFNVIPEPRDAAHPKNWVSDALFLPESRAALRRIVHQGWTDAIRIRDPWSARGPFTFWDYQAGAFDRDDGIRIDHLLLSPQAADLLIETGVDREARAGEKPSDHVPVWVRLAA